MSAAVNQVRNPHFVLGREAPRHWDLRLDPNSCEVLRGPERLVLAPKAPAPAFAWQVLRCKPDAYYRVEAVVRCQLIGAGEHPGAVLAVCDNSPDGPLDFEETPPLLDCPEPVQVRAYFQAPFGCQKVRVGVGVRDAVGLVEILDVRFIRILEPDEMSHPLAVLPWFAPPPPPVESVGLCSNLPTERPLSALLELALGPGHLRTMPHDPFEPSGFDTVILPDPHLPRATRRLHDLIALSQDRVVIVSLPAFSRVARTLRLLRIEQPDDPIHAKVVYAHDATRGFTLHDCFPFAWAGKSSGSFAQNHFRRNHALTAFLKRHHFKVLLVSSCDKDSTSDQPICLFRAGSSSRGGLYVLDLDPLESAASTFAEPNLAAHLLLSILRRPPCPAGQFTVPVRKEAHLREMIREAANRWDHFYVHDEDIPAEDVESQLVTIGRDDEMYGLPAVPKPVILIRSGLFGGDAGSVYGVLGWLRQLLLHARRPGSYAAAIASRFRLAWLPSTAPWHPLSGWSASNAAALPAELEFEGGQIAALIDVESRSNRQLRVVFARPSRLFHHAMSWLPVLDRCLSAPEFIPLTCGTDLPESLRPHQWRRLALSLEVDADPGGFEGAIHREALAAGGEVIRLELPHFEADFVAHSIAYTHLAATLLERTVGLLYGLIAVNRTIQPALVDGLGVIGPGESVIVPGDAGILSPHAIRTG